MATRIDHNQTFENGVCIWEEWVEVQVPDPVDPAVTAFVAALTTEQQQAFRTALEALNGN
jgi:hypothetical protein